MRNITIRFKLIAIGCGLLIWGVAIHASGPSVEQLTKNYNEYRYWKNKIQPAQVFPFYLTTKEVEDGFRARMAITSKYSLQSLAKLLRNQRVWCEFMLLHLNIKACVSWVNDTGKWITFFVGKKSYETTDDSKPLILEYRAKDTQNLLSVEMYAKKGPYGTSDYRIQLYVIPIEDGVYWELRISQRFGFIAKRLTNLYLSTVAKEKVGFTIVGRNKSGQIEYVGGQQGVAERNIVRYLLAIKVYLETQVRPSGNLFQKRAELWFKETERYRRQLHELNRNEYLQNKIREYQNQIQLQKKYDGTYKLTI